MYVESHGVASDFAYGNFTGYRVELFAIFTLL